MIFFRERFGYEFIYNNFKLYNYKEDEYKNILKLEKLLEKLNVDTSVTILLTKEYFVNCHPKSPKF